jgi:hypothetical protein
MKTKVICLLMLIVCFSCGRSDKPLSDSQKEKIRGEVKEVMNNFIAGVEQPDFDKASSVWLDSPDFVFQVNGSSYSYSDVMELGSAFDAIQNQKCTILDENYLFLDKSAVIYTLNSKWEVNYKDGHSTIEEPEAMMVLLRKTGDSWKAASLALSYVEKTVKYPEPSKDIDQKELMKQFTGLWIVNSGKDTISYWEAKPYGTGMECNYRTVVKGRILSEGKQLFGYDKKTDKYLMANLVKGMDQEIGVLWFTSKNNFIITDFEHMSAPDQSPLRVEGEFMSPTVYAETVFINGKKTGSYTYNRK